jgi:hypothetical protein
MAGERLLVRALGEGPFEVDTQVLTSAGGDRRGAHARAAPNLGKSRRWAPATVTF